MTELKTLKEIPFDETHFIIEQTIDKDWIGQDELRKNCVSKIDLRQEAINHINYIKTHKPHIEWEMVEVIDPEAKPLLKQVLTYEGKVLVEYLKYLFNITEEDLKGGLE